MLVTRNRIGWASLFFIPGTSQSQLGEPLSSFGVFTVQVVALTVVAVAVVITITVDLKEAGPG